MHAHNPHGFAHERRVTEGNVDLNRNFVDFSQPLPDNTGYDHIHDLVVPPRWTKPARVMAAVKIGAYVATHGPSAFQGALTGGQYSHPDGLFFGGREATWSHRITRQVTKTYVVGHDHVAVLDFHTGLGRRGQCELIVDGTESDPGYRRAREWYGAEVKSPTRGDSVSAAVTGTVGSAYRNAVGPDKCTFVTLEYGTRSGLVVLQALMADNWFYLHGEVSSEEGRRIKRQTRQAFYGEDRRWKEQVWTHAQDVARTTLTRLAAV